MKNFIKNVGMVIMAIPIAPIYAFLMACFAFVEAIEEYQKYVKQNLKK